MAVEVHSPTPPPRIDAEVQDDRPQLLAQGKKTAPDSPLRAGSVQGKGALGC